MKHDASDYSLRIWLTSIIGSPILLGFLALATGTTINLAILFTAFIFGLILSLPGASIFYFACRFVSKQIRHIAIIRILLSLLGALINSATFWAFNSFNVKMSDVTLAIFITYGSTTLIGIWIYKLNPANETGVANTPNDSPTYQNPQL